MSLKYHPPASNHRKNVVEVQKMKPPNSTAPKVAETKQPMKVLRAAHTRVSVEAGRGRAAGPPPYALPPRVHVVREGPPPKAQVSSSLARPWPMPRPACPFWCDVCRHWPCPSGDDPPLVKPSANRPLEPPPLRLAAPRFDSKSCGNRSAHLGPARCTGVSAGTGPKVAATTPAVALTWAKGRGGVG